MKSAYLTAQNSIVKINNLNHYFGKKSLRKPILIDINLDLKARETVILTGPSGSGKTTLLTLIGGLRSVQAGSLKFLGQELLGANQNQLVKIRRKIGYIFQGHNLLEFLTVRQNIQISLELDRTISERAAKIRVEKMLHAVKLGDHGDYYPQQLSGGQKQRVAIARALVGHPKLFLADEPTAALDSKTGKDVIRLLQQLACQQGAAILIVTHDNRILSAGDRIIRIEDGRLSDTKYCSDRIF
ncbi:MAG: ATP-binding cassette domain-containing protein [Pleurocapsa sp.]